MIFLYRPIENFLIIFFILPVWSSRNTCIVPICHTGKATADLWKQERREEDKDDTIKNCQGIKLSRNVARSQCFDCDFIFFNSSLLLGCTLFIYLFVLTFLWFTDHLVFSISPPPQKSKPERFPPNSIFIFYGIPYLSSLHSGCNYLANGVIAF